jgi:hypothetical protein
MENKSLERLQRSSACWSLPCLNDTDDQKQIVTNFERMHKEYIIDGAK